jgi:heme exporter protein D
LELDVELGPHAAFIIAAYAAGVLLVLLLVGWVVADYRAQLRTLAELERQGVARRSAAPERDAA